LQAIKANRVFDLKRNENMCALASDPLPLRTSPMLKPTPIPLAPSVIPLFSKSESRNINRLVLISFRLARARAGTDRFSHERISVALAAFAGLPRVTSRIRQYCRRSASTPPGPEEA
jgi:hypothetical protein